MPPFTPTWVVPHPGGGPLRPVSPSGLRVGTRDGAAYAVVRWWSGIAPCSVLRSVTVGVGEAPSGCGWWREPTIPAPRARSSRC